VSVKISGKQSKASRGLLKWNIHDLCSRVNITSKRVESFERGTIQLQASENSELVKVYKDSGIEFLSDFEVRLKKGSSDAPAMSKNSGSGVGEHIVISMNELSSLSVQSPDDGKKQESTVLKEAKKGGVE
jgi:hypothetical protein